MISDAQPVTGQRIKMMRLASPVSPDLASGPPALEPRRKPLLRPAFRPRKYFWPAAVFIAALTIRLIYGLTGPGELSDPDEAVYRAIASNILEGKGIILNRYREASFPPLYPVFLAGLQRIGLGSIRDIRLAQAFLGAGSCLWLMGIARAAFPRHANSLGVIAALFLAVYPPAIWYGRQVMTETVFLFLLLSGMYCLFRGIAGRGMYYWLGGAAIFFGLGMLCRPTLMPFAFVIPLWIVFVRPDLRFRRLVSYLLPLILVIAPWGIRNYRLFHRIVPITTQAGNILYLANNPLATGGTVSISYYLNAGVYHPGDEEDELSYNREYGRRAVAFIVASPPRFFRLCWRRLAWFYHLDGHYHRPVLLIPFWGIIVLAGAGFWLVREHWKITVPLILLIMNFTVIHMVFPPEGRYRLPVMPVFFLFAAVALTRFIHNRVMLKNARAGMNINDIRQ